MIPQSLTLQPFAFSSAYTVHVYILVPHTFTL